MDPALEWVMSDSIEDMVGDELDRQAHTYDAARAESDLAFIAKKRREIEWWQHNIDAANEKITRAEERIKQFAIAYRQTVGGAQISLANGFVTVSKQRERTEIYDRPAFRKWMESREWAEDYYDKVLSETKVKSNIFPDEDGLYRFPTGRYDEERGTTRPVLEVVPGIRRVKPGPLDFNVKINAGRTHTEEKDDDESDS
jgi:hypothetical protein